MKTAAKIKELSAALAKERKEHAEVVLSLDVQRRVFERIIRADKEAVVRKVAGLRMELSDAHELIMKTWERGAKTG